MEQREELNRARAMAPKEKKSLNWALIVYISLLILLFAILPIGIIPESVKVIVWVAAFIGLIIRAIYLFIKLGKYDSQNRFDSINGEEDIIRTWRSLPSGAEMNIKRTK